MNNTNFYDANKPFSNGNSPNLSAISTLKIPPNSDLNAIGIGTIPQVFPLWSIEDVLQIPDTEWIVEGLIQRGDFGAIFGDSGSGKSFVVIDSIMAACTSSPLADHFQIARPLKCLYTYAEGGSGIRNRFRAALNKWHHPDVTGYLKISPITPQLFDSTHPEFVDVFIEEMLQSQFFPDLIFIDTYNLSIIGGVEERSSDTSIIVQNCNRLRRELGCAAIIVHHTPKGRTELRGSGALRASLDFAISVSTIGNGHKRVISCDKLKDSNLFNDITFSIMPDDLSGSAYLRWDEPTSFQAAQDNVIGRCFNFLTENRGGGAFTVKNLMHGINYGNEKFTKKCLDVLVLQGKIERRLRNPERSQSSNNPSLYLLP